MDLCVQNERRAPCGPFAEGKRQCCVGHIHFKHCSEYTLNCENISVSVYVDLSRPIPLKVALKCRL